MTDQKYIIAPSILASDFARLGDEVKNVMSAHYLLSDHLKFL